MDHTNHSVDSTRWEFVTFSFDGRYYGVHVVDTKEIIKPPRITKVFHTQKRIFGMINHRGDIYVVFDIRPLLGLEASVLGAESRIIIMKDRIGPRFGFLVDAIGDIMQGEEYYASKQAEAEEDRIIEGVFRKGDETINIIDMQRIYGFKD